MNSNRKIGWKSKMVYRLYIINDDGHIKPYRVGGQHKDYDSMEHALGEVAENCEAIILPQVTWCFDWSDDE
jgi:hypothetical protein